MNLGIYKLEGNKIFLKNNWISYFIVYVYTIDQNGKKMKKSTIVFTFGKTLKTIINKKSVYDDCFLINIIIQRVFKLMQKDNSCEYI